MGKSSLVVLCCAPLILFDQAYALSSSKTTTIYGLEQGIRLKVPKYSTQKYILQLGSFESHANAVNFKNLIAKQTDNPVHIVPVKGIPIRYNVIIGPIPNAANLINISHQLLAKIAKAQRIKPAKNKKLHLNPVRYAELKKTKKQLKTRRIAFPATNKKWVKLGKRQISGSQGIVPHSGQFSQLRRQKKIEGNVIEKQTVRGGQPASKDPKPVNAAQSSQLSAQTSNENLIEENERNWQSSLLIGFENSAVNDSPLVAIAPDDQSLYQSPLLSTPKEIDVTLKNQERIERDKFQVFSLLNQNMSNFTHNNCENHEHQEDQNWEKNLFLGLAEEEQRIRAAAKGRSPNNTEPFSLAETRDNQIMIPEKTRSSVLEDKPLDHPSLAQLAFAGTEIPSHLLSMTEQSVNTKPYSYNGNHKANTLISYEPKTASLRINPYNLLNKIAGKVKIIFNNNQWAKFTVHMLTYHFPVSDVYLFSLNTYQLVFANLQKLLKETKKPVSLFTQLKASSDTLLSEEMINQIKTMPYNDDLFKLAVQTMVYNAHISDAYQLALIAVKNRPNNLTWRKKLGELALWAGDYSTGLKEWFYVVNRTKDPTALNYLIKVSKTLGFEGVLIDTLKMYLAKQPNDTAAYVELAQAQNREGQPQRALSTLQSINSKNPTEAAYELSGKIYDDLGQWDNELKVWQKIDAMYGPSVKSVMAQAVIYYSRGQFREAVEVLKRGIPVAKNKDIDFWQTLADLAWIINDRPMIILSYSRLPNDLSTVLALIQVETANNPLQALKYSLKGWHDFKDPQFFLSALNLAQRLNNWRLISHLLLSLSDKQLKLVEKNELFWQTQAYYYALLGAQDLERKVLLKAISLHPKMYQVTSDLLWLVISNGEDLWIKKLMEYVVEQNLMDNPYIWHVFAQGFDTLNRFYTSILVFQKHILETWPDAQILIDYTAVLERAKRYQDAYDMRLVIWQQELLKASQISFFDKKSLQAIAQLSPHFVSGTDQIELFNTMLSKELNLDDLNILLNWIVPRNYYGLMAYFKANYYHNVLPDWAGINLALIQNDLPTLQTIIEHKERAWPRSDRINAAERLENLPLAVDFAFQELTDRPTAHEIFPEYTIYALKLASYFEAGEQYEQFIDVVGPKTNFETRFRLTNSLRLTPSLSAWSVKSNKPDQITNVPNDYQTKIKLEQKIHRGEVKYTLGYRKALSGFIPASIDINYELGHKWSANLLLGYNQEVFQNSFLRLGGVQDQINLILYNNITKKDLLSLEVQGLKYYSQDRHYLASGCNLFATLQHKFFLNYPDFTLGVFGHLYTFNRNGSFSGNVTRLFPNLAPGQISDISELPSIIDSDFKQLIPQTYREAGGYFSFGDTIQEYTHVWRPYLWASLFYNSITRLSNDIKGGINGTVFGRDSLLIYLERGQASSVANAINYMVGIRYKIYF